MSDLPEGWVERRVDDLITLNPKNAAGLDASAAFMPMTLVGTKFLDRPMFQVRKWGEIAKNYVHFGDGDVLLAKITPCFENGKAGIAEGLPSGIGAGSSEFFVCRSNAAVLDPRWLLAYFKTSSFLAAGARQMSGSVGHKRVPKNVLLESTIPVPPRAEQQRIADKLEAVLGRVDACRDRLDRVRPLLQRFRQSVLAAAVSGQLISAWRGLPTSAEWEKTTLGQLAEIGTGSTPLRSKAAFFADQGTPWITSSATSRQFIDTADEYVTDLAIKAHRLRVYPPGTLLVAMYGEGKTRGQVAELSIHATINQACAAILVDESAVLKDFVKLALRANYLAMRLLAEGGNQPNLNLSKVRSVPLLLPSLDEQAELVRRVRHLFGLADRLEHRLATALNTAGRLTPAVLAKAFRGELVPQDPTDEPAQALLDRLHAARASEPPGRRRRQPAGA